MEDREDNTPTHWPHTAHEQRQPGESKFWVTGEAGRKTEMPRKEEANGTLVKKDPEKSRHS